MLNAPSKKTADSRPTESTAAPADRLLHFAEVHALLGSNCKTGHTARAYAAKGFIRAVRITERTIRYSENSVRDFIAGRAT